MMSSVGLPSEIMNTRFAFLINAPESHAHSNGIAVMLSSARLARQMGVDVVVVPTHTTTPLYHRLPSPYSDIPLCWEVPSGCCAIVCDTIIPERLLEVRARAKRICHYSCAPIGLFRGKGAAGDTVHIAPGERQAVYSPFVSTQFPYFYMQCHFHELEPWLCGERASRRSCGHGHKLKACFYAGKGYLSAVSPALRKLISRPNSHLITRLWPDNKKTLYSIIADFDLVISFDPISSLSFEANLLGVPVLVKADWDEPDALKHFPVRLDGIAWNNESELLTKLECGFDHDAVVRSYREALSRNADTLVRLLSFAMGLLPFAPRPVDINGYWKSREPFFKALNLPSSPNDWGPINKALPGVSFYDRVCDIDEWTFRDPSSIKICLIKLWCTWILPVALFPRKCLRRLYRAIKRRSAGK